MSFFIFPKNAVSYGHWTVDRFTKKLFWNFKKCRVDSMDSYQAKQMSEKNFVPNVAPSAGSGIIFSCPSSSMPTFLIH